MDTQDLWPTVHWENIGWFTPVNGPTPVPFARKLSAWRTTCECTFNAYMAEERRIRADMPWVGLLMHKTQDEIRNWLIRIPELADPDTGRRKWQNVPTYIRYFVQHCFICRPSDSTVSEDAGTEPRTVTTLALATRRSNHSARSHSHSEGENDPKFLLLKFLCYEDLGLYFDGFCWRVKILHGGLDKNKYGYSGIFFKGLEIWPYRLKNFCG